MDMKIFRRRAASLLLALLFIIAALPVAYAADDDVEEDELPLNAVQFEVRLETAGVPTGSEYAFDLAATDDAPMPENTSVTITDSGTAKFDPISYDDIGEYYYTITMRNENIPSRCTYDDTVYDVVVRVKYDNLGELVATYFAKTVTTAYNPETGLDEELVAKEAEILFTSNYVSPSTPKVTPAPEPEEDDGPVIEPTPTPEPEPTPTPEVTPAPTDTPKTGDSTNVIPWVMLLCAVVIGIFCCVRYLASLTKRGDRR
jgi:pilin isopeptide linkage protein